MLEHQLLTLVIDILGAWDWQVLCWHYREIHQFHTPTVKVPGSRYLLDMSSTDCLFSLETCMSPFPQMWHTETSNTNKAFISRVKLDKLTCIDQIILSTTLTLRSTTIHVIGVNAWGITHHGYWVIKTSTDTKISNLGLSIKIYKQVGRFDVPMHQVSFSMQKDQTLMWIRQGVIYHNTKLEPHISIALLVHA